MTELEEEKRFYERFYALHRDPLLVKIYERFGIGVFRRSCVLEGFNDFIQKHGFAGKRVVEIGTCNGLTALILARYFGEVVSIDIEPSALKHQIAAFVGVENIRFIDVRDNAEKLEVIRALPAFDAAFSDGDHARDTVPDFKMVAGCGRVLSHEHWSAQPAVVALYEQLKSSGKVETAGKFALWTAA